MLYCKLRTLIVIHLVISRLLNFISKLVVTNSQFREEAEEHYFLMFFSIMLPLPAPPKNHTLASLFPASFIRVLPLTQKNNRFYVSVRNYFILLYKENFIRTRGSFLVKFKNKVSLSMENN